MGVGMVGEMEMGEERGPCHLPSFPGWFPVFETLSLSSSISLPSQLEPSLTYLEKQLTEKHAL